MPANAANPANTPPALTGDIGLIADIGATNARFALTLLKTDIAPDIAPGWHHEQVLPVAAFSGPEAAIKAYLDTVPGTFTKPTCGVLAIAGPVQGDALRLTNHQHIWSFSLREAAQNLGWRSLFAVNDFVANALAVPHLRGTDLRHICGPEQSSQPTAPRAVIGPGSGLGAAILVPSESENPTWRALATEGGHATLAANTPRQAEIIARLRQDFEHVSAERLICGPGLSLLYKTLHSMHHPDTGAPDLTPAEVTGRAMENHDPVARECLSLFFSFLGGMAGNFILGSGSTGGLFLMGGILPRLEEPLRQSGFAQALIAKGRFKPYLEAVPVYLVTHPYPAFPGLIAYLREHSAALK